MRNHQQSIQVHGTESKLFNNPELFTREKNDNELSIVFHWKVIAIKLLENWRFFLVMSSRPFCPVLSLYL